MKLKQGCSIYSDYGLNISAEEYSDEGVPIIRTSDVDNSGALDLSNTKYVEPHVVGTKRLRKGDVLFSRSGTIGRAMVFGDDVEATYAAYLVRFRPHPKRLLSKFIGYWAQSAGYWHQIGADTIQSTIGNFNANKFANLSIPEHDLATQRQIADFLDRETARIDLLVEKKQRLVGLLGEKVRSDVHDLFHSLDAQTWRIRHLGKVKNGAGFPVELQGDASNEIPFFKVKHLAVNGLDQRITVSDDTITKETARTLRAAAFPIGTIVFAKIGAALLLGRFSMLGVEGCIDNNLAAFVVNKRLVDPDYLLLCLERFEMQLMVQPGAVPSLSTEKFINQSVPLPSLDVQRELVEMVRRAVQRNGCIVQRTQDSIARLKEYRSALITAAVTGQIDVSTHAKSGTFDRRLDAIQEEMGA